MEGFADIALETERLVLRPLREQDARDIVAYAGDPEAYRWTIAIPHPYKESDALDFVRFSRERMAEGKTINLGIELKGSGTVVGGVGFAKLDLGNMSGELGYVVAREHWNKGIATEAARALMDLGFGELGLERICVKHFEGNPRSRRVNEKLGFTYEGRARHEVLKDGEYIDTLNYSMLRGEWERSQG